MSTEIDTLRELVAAYWQAHEVASPRLHAALVEAKRLVAEADAPAPVYDLDSLRTLARAKGYSVQGDARQGCFNVYDNVRGTYVRGQTAHAFCVSLREVADLLDSVPALAQAPSR